MKKLQCLRCLHKWYPRTKNKPVLCPNCKSKYWNKERKNGKINIQGIEKTIKLQSIKQNI